MIFSVGARESFSFLGIRYFQLIAYIRMVCRLLWNSLIKVSLAEIAIVGDISE